jgi:hypothetical protein
MKYAITGKDITGNKGIENYGKASDPTRYSSLDDLVKSDKGFVGYDNDYDFIGDGEPDDEIFEAVTQFNSRLDLDYELPSTRNPSKWTAQNK